MPERCRRTLVPATGERVGLKGKTFSKNIADYETRRFCSEIFATLSRPSCSRMRSDFPSIRHGPIDRDCQIAGVPKYLGNSASKLRQQYHFPGLRHLGSNFNYPRIFLRPHGFSPRRGLMPIKYEFRRPVRAPYSY
jgi:hypothetical protein